MRVLVACTLALVVLAFASCGGSSDRDETPRTGAGEAPTRQEFIAAGDRICARVNDEVGATNRKLQALTQEGGLSQSEKSARVAELVQEAYLTQRGAHAEFKALRSPPGDVATVDKINEAYEQQVALLGRLADATRREDAAAVAPVRAELERVATRARGLVQGYGFKSCGSLDASG